MLDDLVQRFPATLELVTFGLLLAILVGVPLGVASAFNEKGWLGRVANFYGLTAGALPDFWLALVLIFVFYTILQVVPAPLGRIDFIVLTPATVTGFLTIDSLLAGNWQAFYSAASHLCLPVLTLGLVNAGPILKMTQSTMDRMLQSDYSRYEVLSGLPRGMVVRHALRNSLPSIITIISVLYGYLLGGAVLVEIVFSWGGAGQYAVQGVLNSDIYPVLASCCSRRSSRCSSTWPWTSFISPLTPGSGADMLKSDPVDVLGPDTRPRPPAGRISSRPCSPCAGLRSSSRRSRARPSPSCAASI